jgi:phospholipase C
MKNYAVLVATLLLFQSPSVIHLSAGGAATPIDHLIVIMQENHSFDNYFGTYPTANGTLANNITLRLTPVNGIPNGVCEAYLQGCVSPHPADSSTPSNPGEGQLTYENDYAQGEDFPMYSGPQSMVYFDYHTIPAYWDYAELYGLADNYFAPVLAQTNPNRIMLFAGDSPVSNDAPPTLLLNYSQTVLDQLDSAGVSWGYFDFKGSLSGYSQNFPLEYFSGSNASNYKVQDVSSFLQDLAQGSGLPSVSYVNALPSGFDEHPPSDVIQGEQWVVSVVNSVMRSSYWSSCAILITYDEGGGFYDHVVPPSLFTIDHGFTHPLQGLGQRVPLLVISPFSRTNYVSHTLLSHLSVLHFIEYNWGLPPLNPRVLSSNLPLDFFDFSQSSRTPTLLGTGSQQTSVAYPFSLPPSGGRQNSIPEFPSIPLPAILLAAAIVLTYAGWSLTRRAPRGQSHEA